MADLSEEKLAAALKELIADPGRRARMTDNARTLVDGKGAERVAAKLIARSRRRSNG